MMSSSSVRYYTARIGILLIVFALAGGMVGCDGNPTQLGEIRTWYDLDDIRDNMGGSYVLVNDLDSTTRGYAQLAGPTADGGEGWQPIGTSNYPLNDPFTGTFDGQGYKIRDLFISRPDESTVGLFGYVGEGGHIEDIGVVSADVTGNSWVGGLVGVNEATISNSYFSGSVTGDSVVGGLVGRNDYTVSNSYSSGGVSGFDAIGGLVGENRGTVSDSYSSGNVTGDNQYVGGLVGELSMGIVRDSYASGNVTGYTVVGGLVGSTWVGTVNRCYSTGSVTGVSNVGGLAGANVQSTVSKSYSSANVTGTVRVGGLVGRNGGDGFHGTVSYSYSTGSVTGAVDVGGLVGWNDGSVSNSFWDMETSGQTASAGGTGRTTAEMMSIGIFSEALWNIIAVALNETNPAYTWNIVNNVTYPFLGWQL